MDVTGGHLDSAWGLLGWLRAGPGLWEMRDPREGTWHFASRGHKLHSCVHKNSIMILKNIFLHYTIF